MEMHRWLESLNLKIEQAAAWVKEAGEERKEEPAQQAAQLWASLGMTAQFEAVNKGGVRVNLKVTVAGQEKEAVENTVQRGEMIKDVFALRERLPEGTDYVWKLEYQGGKLEETTKIGEWYVEGQYIDMKIQQGRNVKLVTEIGGDTRETAMLWEMGVELRNVEPVKQLVGMTMPMHVRTSQIIPWTSKMRVDTEAKAHSC